MAENKNVHYAPCKAACPILTDAREYIQLIAERRYPEAFASIRRLNPLPRVVGRICTHPCETNCKRGQLDAPIAIAALKRFAADGEWVKGTWKAPMMAPSGRQVAVVGSGPAGLAAAHDLALKGHQVTLFEALPVLGGMLRVGVPEYRLPKEVVDDEIDTIVNLGVTVRTEVTIGKDVKAAELLDQGFEAVFVAIGAHEDRKLGIPGEDELDGVFSAVSFLRSVNLKETLPIAGDVAVIGGGNTAIDSARSALRMGAETVTLVYRRSKEEMPAADEEIEEAAEEGVTIEYLTSPVEIQGHEGKVAALRCVRNELGEPDAGGRRRPSPISGSEYTMDVGVVICAIGQVPQSDPFAEDFDIAQRGGRIHVEAAGTLATTKPAFFAGGDAVTGPATVIQAIGAGKRAAISIDAYLQGKSVAGVEQSESKAAQLPERIIRESKTFERCSRQTRKVETRRKDFQEVEASLPEQTAVKEALRCLHCYLGARIDPDKCISCLTCVRVCPLGIPTANHVGEVTIDPVACQACGICMVECPVRAIDIGLNRRSKLHQEMETGIEGLDDGSPKVIAFLDLYGDFDASHMARLKEDYPNIFPVTLFGLRRLDTVDIFRAFGLGATGVLLAKCSSDADPFPDTAERINRVVDYTGELLESLGRERSHLALYEMAGEGLVDKVWLDEWMGGFE